MKKIVQVIIVFVLILNFAGCDCSGDKNQDDSWEKQILSHRAKTDSIYANALDSPFAGKYRFTLDKEGDNYLNYRDDEFSTGNRPGPGILFKIRNADGQWLWESFNDTLTLNSGAKMLTDGTFPPGRATGTFKRFHFVYYVLDAKMVAIIFDPQREAFVNFKHLLYYPSDSAYRVEVKMEKFENPEKVDMTTSRDLTKSFYRYGKLKFSIRGERKILMAYKSDLSKTGEKSWLFIPFKDNTSGSETYAAGRFLELKEPQSDTFVLDFNLAFNPLCNYADVYNCSYPPPENHLDIAIEAGEKTYPMVH